MRTSAVLPVAIAAVTALVTVAAVGCTSTAPPPQGSGASAPTGQPGPSPEQNPGPSVDAASAPPTRVLADHVASPSALLAEPDGSLLYAERLTGVVRRIDADGRLVDEPVATVPVVGGDDDQRGLLSLARDLQGRLLAVWTAAASGANPTGQITAGQVTVGQIDVVPPRIIWDGPVSADLANGGHLAVLPDGGVILGIGDLLQDRALDADASVPNRKVLRLDADGPRSQRPSVLSSGWNNPFALTTTADGQVWVADNTGADGPERIGRGDRPAGEATALGGPGIGEVVPSALVDLGGGRLALCTYKGGDLREISIAGGRARVTGRVLAAPCAVAAARLPDGRLVTATADQLRVTTEAAP